MSEKQNVLTDMALGQICRHQYEEIERKNILLWDFEEENAVLYQKISAQKTLISEKSARISELEQWCGHLQSCYDSEKEKNLQLWDWQEENRLLQEKVAEQQQIIHQRNVRIDELEKWCGYLQSCLDREKKYNILARIARRIKRIFFGC